MGEVINILNYIKEKIEVTFYDETNEIEKIERFKTIEEAYYYLYSLGYEKEEEENEDYFSAPFIPELGQYYEDYAIVKEIAN